MKILIFCLVLGTVLKFNAAEELPTGCPANEDPRYPTHLPHTTDCGKFWKCWDGVPQLNECPQGHHWSIENSWCDYPENAKCVRPLPEDGGENGGENGGETDLPKGCPANEDPRYPTHLPHATDCDKFWKCWDGVPHLNECPQGQHWSIEHTWCDYIDNAKCARPLPEDGEEENGEDGVVVELPKGCPANEDPRYPTHLPHATDCDKFWKCWDGVPNLNECPPGQHWSIENSWCDYPEYAKCVRPLPEDGGENGGEESGETDLPKNCPANEDPLYPTHLPHATDCDKFWKCWDGVPHLHECPEGQHWSIEYSWCDYIENAKCVRPLPEDGGGNGEESEEESKEESEEESKEESEEETGPPSECPGIEDPSGPDHFPHSTDCTKFWQCVDGNAYLTECPSGLHWNIDRQYCDYPANANCVRPLQNAINSIVTSSDVAKGYSCPAVDDIDNPVHLPHASDCTKFWKCYDGKPVIHECPGGLEWSIEGNYCDYSFNANCVRPIQEINTNVFYPNLEVAQGYKCPAEEDFTVTVHLPHSSDCTKFWKCFAGQPVIQDCPGGLQWSITGEYCDYPSAAKCVRPLLN